jgi:signal transduction histidine kinase/CheY-like chemotaxis protein
VLLNSAPLQDEAGKTVGAITSFVDLTERKKHEQQALRSQRLESIGTLAGGIAHDLNNSLGPIAMVLELLRLEQLEPASLDLIDLADSSAQRAADMVRQILSFARGVEGQRKAVQVTQLVREIEKFVTDTFGGQMQIKAHVAPDVWTLNGDFTQLYQVLLNLCLNGRDAMPEGGTLLVSAENRQVEAGATGLQQNPKAQPGRYVVLEVTDSGSGIPPTLLESIFDPFFTTKPFGRGSGLGLSSSLGIVRSHGGFIDVRTALGEGTTFQVFLPAQVDADPPLTQPVAPALPRGDGELILVVDDELPMRLMTQRILEAFGYQVILACDGAEAVAIFQARQTEIAAMITDMTMPVLDGPEAIRRVREIRQELPIVGVSGAISTTYAEQLAGLGVRHILAKPYTAAELLQMLARARADTGREISPAPRP